MRTLYDAILHYIILCFYLSTLDLDVSSVTNYKYECNTVSWYQGGRRRVFDCTGYHNEIRLSAL